MNPLWKKPTALTLILLMVFLPMFGCSSSSSDGVQAQESDPGQLYYDSLAANSYLDHDSAQVPVDLFAAVKHFNLVQSGEITPLSYRGSAPYVVYRPASAVPRATGIRLQATTQADEGIPGFKPGDEIPTVCQGLSDDDLLDCLEGEELSAVPPAAHSSYFDAEALAALFGNSFSDALIDKVFESKLAHVDGATRDRIIAQLSDYIDDGPAHASLDLAQHQVFDRSGYKLVGATLTDSSRGDTDGDGDMDQHSTLMIQVSKELDYTRSGHSELDAIFLHYLGFVPKESYLVNLQILLHLTNLHELRYQVEPLSPEGILTLEEELDQLEREWGAIWINKSLDANILKHIVGTKGPTNWESSEYTLSFQVAPDNIIQHLEPIMAATLQTGDWYGHNLVEHHINAQTAIITGSAPAVSTLSQAAEPQTRIFYQVSRPSTDTPSLLSSSDATNRRKGWDYVMLDANGNRVAIRDPASGSLVLAEEPSRHPLVDEPSVQPLWSKSGACQNSRSDWAYWPSRVRTGNFGRGINWILTESLLHNQVGDYKNIRWYQSAWKSSAQVAIKSGMWVVKNYLKVQLGGAGKSEKTSDYALYYLLEVLMPTLADALSDKSGNKGKSFKIAGYGYQIESRVIRFFREASLYRKDQTFAGKAGAVIKGAVIGFLIDRAADGVGQSLDVTVTGWQDYSDSSHYGCFLFSY